MANALDQISSAVTSLSQSAGIIATAATHIAGGTTPPVDPDALTGDQARAVAADIQNVATGIASSAQLLQNAVASPPAAT